MINHNTARSRRHSRAIAARAALLALSAFAAHGASAYTLWATHESYPGPGQFFGPGNNIKNQRMFDLVIYNLSFATPTNFVTPFFNNLQAAPNTCAERELSSTPDGRLANGLLINENVDACPLDVAGMRLLPAVVRGGSHGGQQFAVELHNGELVMTMDLALDMNEGEKGVTQLPFYATTGTVTVPRSLQTQKGGTGVDQAGVHASGTQLTGRVGDFNHDGWIDGTLVVAGVMPLESGFHAGQPFAAQINFETDIPVDGVVAGDMRGLKNSRLAKTGSR